MVNAKEDTEFNDALRAHGILPPKQPSRSPSPDSPHLTHSQALQSVAATADASQLITLLEGDNLDSDDERMFEDYKRKRIQGMRVNEKRGRFGTMEPLGREDFVREVTEGSRVSLDDAPDQNEEEEDEAEGGKPSGRLRGTGVVVFLYKDSLTCGVPLSQHLRPLLIQLAAVHPSTKFISIPASLCIPNYPDKNVPTLLIYRDGEMLGNVVAGAGLNGMKTSVQDLEGLLIWYKAMEGPSSVLRRRKEADGEEEDRLGHGVGMINARRGGLRNGRGNAGGDDDSGESDLDM